MTVNAQATVGIASSSCSPTSHITLTAGPCNTSIASTEDDASEEADSDGRRINEPDELTLTVTAVLQP